MRALVALKCIMSKSVCPNLDAVQSDLICGGTCQRNPTFILLSLLSDKRLSELRYLLRIKFLYRFQILLLISKHKNCLCFLFGRQNKYLSSFDSKKYCAREFKKFYNQQFEFSPETCCYKRSVYMHTVSLE